MRTMDFENGEPKRSFWRFGIIFLAITVLAVAAVWGYGKYVLWRGTQNVERMAEGFKKASQDEYNREMADTYGGKTPQETLQMYISAVEKGDYDLASRYLTSPNKEKEVEQLNLLRDKGNVGFFLNILKGAKPSGEAINNIFEMKSAIKSMPDYYVKFFLYPNGIWKITEI